MTDSEHSETRAHHRQRLSSGLVGAYSQQPARLGLCQLLAPDTRDRELRNKRPVEECPLPASAPAQRARTEIDQRAEHGRSG